ncbi:MAG: HAD family hydrolase [Phototrophicaceae bacterium]
MDIKRNIQYIVIDLDGTLLNDDHKVSDRNKEVIKKVIAQGVKVILATGKTRQGAESVIAELGLDTPGVFVQGLILYNADGTVRQEQALEPSIARHVIQYAESEGFEVVAYSGNRLVCRYLDDAVEEITTFGEPMPQAVGSLINQVHQIKMNKLIVVGGSKRKLKALRWQLDQQIGGKVSFTDGGVLTSLEVLPKGVNKGQGVKTLLRQLSANAENVMGIGDAENDVEMLKTVGFAVAVKNAAEKTKAVADEIVASNNDDGVAEAIERFVLKAEVLEETSASTTPDATTTPSDDSASQAKPEGDEA